ncbi:MAG: hypothetical protein B1H03_06095 [Planctomycetales bacterium 4484_113]|nr:MAG: hypothetical protein B1H03_06095 [Planctomycetales bacterium 4484_113]
MPNQGTGQTGKENRIAVGSTNRYEELLAQAREIMNDPEFMEEVVALARLKVKLESDFRNGVSREILSVLRDMCRRERI